MIPFSWESAQFEAKRLNQCGCSVRIIKKWYGWVIKDKKTMETKQTKQTFNGYTNWQTNLMATWAFDAGMSFDMFKEEFMEDFHRSPGIIQDQIDLTEIHWDEIKEAMEGEGSD